MKENVLRKNKELKNRLKNLSPGTGLFFSLKIYDPL